MNLWLIALWRSIPRKWIIVSLPFVLPLLAFLFWFLFGGFFEKEVTAEQRARMAELAALLPRAEKGDLAAQLRAGVILRDGLTGETDHRAALAWFRKAAGKGSFDARFALGKMFEAGLAVRPSYPKAAEWYLPAARFGAHAPSQYALGELYFYGRGVGHDYGRAIGWYKRAAAAGHPGAQAVIASMYEKGWGVRRDLAEAYVWYSLAAEKAKRVGVYRPEMDVVALRARLAESMSRLQLKKAREKLRRLRRR